MKFAMKKIITLLVFLQSTISMCQNLQVGYANIGRNYGYVGLDALLSRDSSELYATLGAGTFLGAKNKELVALPEIHFNIIPFGNAKHYKVFTTTFMTEVASTNKSFNPSVGFNLVNIIKLKCGYAIPYNKLDDFKGVTFCVVIMLTGYDKIKFM